MALDVLAQGRLIKAPERRTTKTGSAFATATLAVAVDDGESALLSLIVFRAEAVAALLALGKGDACAVTGRGQKITTWPDKTSGEPRAGLSVVVEAVLSTYHVRRKRLAVAGADTHERSGGDD